MALRSLVQLRGFLESIPGGSINIAPTDIQNNTPPQEIIQMILQNGDNIFAVPVLAKGVIIIFAPTSVTVKKLKGAGGDTGIIISKNSWNVITFDTPPISQFIINSDSEVPDGLYTTVLFF